MAMYDDVFDGTDFGDIKNEKEKANVEKNAKSKDIWHTGQKPDVWAVEEETWDTEEDCDCPTKDCDCDEPKQPMKSDPLGQRSTGVFDDIF